MRKTLLSLIIVFITCSKVTLSQDPSWKKPADIAGEALTHGRLQDAEKNFQKALNEMERTGVSGEILADCLGSLELVYSLEGKFTDAQKMYLRAIEVNRSTKEAEYRIAFNLWHLGQLYRYAGKNVDSLALLGQALSLTEKAKGSEHLRIANILITMAEVSVKDEKYNEADAYYRRATAIYEKSLGPDHWTVASALKHHGKVLERLGRKNEAVEAVSRAKKIEAAGKPHKPYKVQN